MIDRLTEADQPRWAELWHAYLAFYDTVLPPGQYALTWRRLQAGGPLQAWALRGDGGLVGIVHYLFHPSAWTPADVCYLQDLYVDPAARGSGGGRQLIEAVAASARAAGAPRLFWLTQAHNETARRLYDRIARHNGFLRYDYAL